jgi:hypothetical protein
MFRFRARLPVIGMSKSAAIRQRADIGYIRQSVEADPEQTSIE